MSEAIEIETRDGVRLGATLFRPDKAAARAVAIQAATGVKQTYYADFAAYLAARGFMVLTYDYRGIGRSRPASLKGYPATMRDWAERDVPAALEHLERAAPGARLMAVGHSFGGQIYGLLPQRERIAAALLVGAQSGYWRHWPGMQRAGMWVFTHLLIPGLTRLQGYAAASRIGMGEDLPAGVALEWVRWCRHPEYVVGVLGAHADYARFRAPLLVISPTDDRYAPPAAVEALRSLYPAAEVEIRRVTPREVGAQRIGHFGFFREPFRDTLWREAADWLEAH
ncbi:MAG: alpha/beta fold hydrolase [Burkholderiales bacterium]|nr:alpha/beta fold hydrolase [Burkholderiales bacterium]